MALIINELGEAEFNESDILNYLKEQPSLGELISTSFVTAGQLYSFPAREGSFTHNGKIFESTITSINQAMEYNRRQLNIWNDCALQDFQDGISGAIASCESDGTL